MFLIKVFLYINYLLLKLSFHFHTKSYFIDFIKVILYNKKSDIKKKKNCQ